ncbi:chaperone protein dnaJ 6-like isoform X1 [Henckelia pumila]|uniref:chaperone protein dnaJ 6-like isoform X1 n=1 Tax=Henckelia pumila TaxID=405737 RepID=UPI003C6E77DF
MEFRGGSPSLYRVLGVFSYSSDEEIRRAYLKLAMQWHPDKWARNPSLLGEAKQKFQKIQEAYSVLSDRKRRRLYDAGLYGPDIEEDEGFSDFLQEMVSLINDARKEEKTYSTKDLQSMFWDMARGFGIPEYDTPKPTHESQWLHAKMNDTATANKRMRRAQHTQNLNSPAYADCKSRSVY